MLSVVCPVWARWHPHVATALMGARLFKVKHTVVLTAQEPAITRQPYPGENDLRTLSSLADKIELRVEPSLAIVGCPSPLITLGGYFCGAGSHCCGEPESISAALFQELSRPVSENELLCRSLLRELDALVLGVQSKNLEEVARAHAAFGHLVKEANARLNAVFSGKGSDAGVVQVASLIPLKTTMDFLTKDCKLILGPYRGVQRIVECIPENISGDSRAALETLSSLAVPTERLILETIKDYSGGVVASIYTDKGSEEGPPHQNILSDVHSLLREYTVSGAKKVSEKPDSGNSSVNSASATEGRMGLQSDMKKSPFQRKRRSLYPTV